MIDSTAVAIRRAEFVRFTTQLDLIGRDPGDIQEVIDESHELPNLTVNHFTGACRIRRRGVRPSDFRVRTE